MILRRALFILFTLIILLINAPMSSAKECFYSIQNASSSLNFNKTSCDVDVSKRYSLWFQPSNAITVNVNADINISNNLYDYAIKWWETSSQFSNEFNNNAIIDIFYSLIGCYNLLFVLVSTII